ncbi:MAG: hypothetical protein ISS15_18850 [Alphaproteobacteria bacterium]|nr:hypothetical protein [Alphaproteobacteria bacterium]MBL6940278.1 hypothetical protein [Alphaproteobacteria bacterium]MBL7099721.1 hypothetical protein [Alphaproteobacteria bacterium]
MADSSPSLVRGRLALIAVLGGLGFYGLFALVAAMNASQSQAAPPQIDGDWRLEGDASGRVMILKQNKDHLTGKVVWKNGGTSFLVDGTISNAGEVKLKVTLDRSDNTDPKVTKEIWDAAVDSRKSKDGMLPLTTASTLRLDASAGELSGDRPVVEIDHTGDKFNTIKESTVAARFTHITNYAQRCRAEMGRIPPFSCLDGTILKITVHGKETHSHVAACDRPVQLNIDSDGHQGQCVPYSRLLRLHNEDHDKVVTVAICRKYTDSDSRGASDPGFDDIAMVSHDPDTGNTCYFQSEPGVRKDASHVPSPTDDDASRIWEPRQPAEGGFGPAGVRCNKCHSAGPFIWSPYVAQVGNVDEWDPLGEWNSNFDDMFGVRAVTFEVGAKNNCRECHRIGNGDNCRIFDPGYTTTPKKFSTAPNEYWMPLDLESHNVPYDATKMAAWRKDFTASMAQIARCCKNPGATECNATAH